MVFLWGGGGPCGRVGSKSRIVYSEITIDCKNSEEVFAKLSITFLEPLLFEIFIISVFIVFREDRKAG